MHLVSKLKVNKLKRINNNVAKTVKTTLQDVLGQLLKYGVASSALTPWLRCYCALARDLSLMFAFAYYTGYKKLTTVLRLDLEVHLLFYYLLDYVIYQ